MSTVHADPSLPINTPHLYIPPQQCQVEHPKSGFYLISQDLVCSFYLRFLGETPIDPSQIWALTGSHGAMNKTEATSISSGGKRSSAGISMPGSAGRPQRTPACVSTGQSCSGIPSVSGRPSDRCFNVSEYYASTECTPPSTGALSAFLLSSCLGLSPG